MFCVSNLFLISMPNCSQLQLSNKLKKKESFILFENEIVFTSWFSSTMIHLHLKVTDDTKIENAFTQFYEKKGMLKWLMYFDPSLIWILWSRFNRITLHQWYFSVMKFHNSMIPNVSYQLLQKHLFSSIHLRFSGLFVIVNKNATLSKRYVQVFHEL